MISYWPVDQLFAVNTLVNSVELNWTLGFQGFTDTQNKNINILCTVFGRSLQKYIYLRFQYSTISPWPPLRDL